MIKFCLLNKCNINIIKIFLYNYKYDFYEYNKNKNNIISNISILTIILIINKQEYNELFEEMNYVLNIGIIRLIQVFTDKY